MRKQLIHNYTSLMCSSTPNLVYIAWKLFMGGGCTILYIIKTLSIIRLTNKFMAQVYILFLFVPPDGLNLVDCQL